MKQLLDFLPLLVFFVAYKIYDLRTATYALIAATALALIYSWFRFRRIEKMMLVAFVLVLIFGGLTIYFGQLKFLEWKVTILYLLFASALLISQWWLKTPLIKRMLQKEIQLPDQVWRRLNFAWALFFIACAIANLYVAFYMSQDAWINFKVFGITGLTLIFSLLSGVYIYRHLADIPKSPQDNEK